ncbi:MAG: hypothetical protein CL519_00150 [Actinobacteria bacterium]|nr:hypothetical protein [Actinomycetota bacterium]
MRGNGGFEIFSDDEVTDAIEIDPEIPHRLDREIFETDTGLLVIESGPRSGSRYALDSELISIGREKDADIFLDDVTVSRRHAIIERNESMYTVSDVGSLNGTYLNAESVRSKELTDGDVLQIGRFKLVFFHGIAGN